MTGQVGWFGWMKSPRGPTPQKYGMERVGFATTTTIRQGEPGYLDILIEEFPLTEDEFKMDLNYLAARYPCPKQPED